ncbi:chymotrypsin inhibitor-like [Xenopus tropicalis]|uniref:Chymotrypsin inhibitor-like n=1 Tax=Xenopus tropicalis TaxID=8364 RepID=A0A8J1JV00_XENTR|nr:chymotrypsin inhibitor-like [Xenopus tropicalis]
MLRVTIAFLVCTVALLPLYAYGQDDDDRCPSDQFWEDCGSDCPLNCGNYQNPPKICTMACRIGCTCKAPKIFLQGKSGACVLPSECPSP